MILMIWRRTEGRNSKSEVKKNDILRDREKNDKGTRISCFYYIVRMTLTFIFQESRLFHEAPGTK